MNDRTQASLKIALLSDDSPDPACHVLPERFYRQFTASTTARPGVGAYTRRCSIFVAPPSFEEYWSAPSSYWLRQRVRRAVRAGYTFGVIDRNRYLDDIFAINTSLDVRQGRVMSEAYRTPPTASTPLRSYSCPRHRLIYYGIVRADALWAYAWIYQVGEMCLFSTILGHGEHMKAGIMPLLVSEIIRDRIDAAGLRYAMYNLHDSGTGGLRFFKEQMGFRPFDVSWQLGGRADAVQAQAEEDLPSEPRGWLGRLRNPTR